MKEMPALTIWLLECGSSPHAYENNGNLSDKSSCKASRDVQNKPPAVIFDSSLLSNPSFLLPPVPPSLLPSFPGCVVKAEGKKTIVSLGSHPRPRGSSLVITRM
eukprot:2760257-Rhodomonas_salina.1